MSSKMMDKRDKVSKFTNNIKKSIERYKIISENPEELKRLYTEYPYFFVTMWLYSKAVPYLPDFYENTDSSITIYNSGGHSLFFRCYLKFFENNDTSKMGKHYIEYILKDTKRLHSNLFCFNLNSSFDSSKNVQFHLFIDKIFIIYILNPIILGEYDEFFEKLSKQTLVRYHLENK